MIMQSYFIISCFFAILSKVQKNSHYQTLKEKWSQKHEAARKRFEEKHKETLAFLIDRIPAKDKIASGAASLIMLSTNLNPATAFAQAATKTPPLVIEENRASRIEKLLSDLKTVVPSEMRSLTPEEEASTSAILSRNFNMEVVPDINGLRLNRTYGMMGAEQHLMRYPGDTMYGHFDSESENFYSSGMAPGRGAWGYFANSKEELTVEDREREKWYIAVQSFLAVDYNSRPSEYRDFFKYRKMLVVNPKTGQAIVSDIADAGPAVWTGKHLGGSPEVMYYLGIHQGPRKGGVLYFFINDPNDTIPLGPINL